MIPIHFQANFLPKHKKFKVEVKTPQGRWVELMTIARYLRWADEIDKPLVIAGMTVKFDGGEESLKAVKQYFKDVGTAYKKVMGYYN